jgi:fermentation-respiration switch protein FrsA (DUF1100 family)
MFRSAPLCFALLAALPSGCQRRLVYDPDPEVRADPSTLGLDYETLSLRTEDDKRIAAWFVPAPKRRGTVIYSHGNGGNIGTRLPMIEALTGLGLDVLVYDYHGYGESEGKPGEKQTYRDAKAAWDWVTDERGISPSETILWGRSLGGAVTVFLATQPHVRPAGVVLESTYTSIVDVGEHLHPKLPVRAFSIYEYPSLERIPQLDAPLLYAHSPDDEIVPYPLGRALFDAAPEPKRFVEMHGKHVPTRLTAEEYRAEVDAFLDEVLAPD